MLSLKKNKKTDESKHEEVLSYDILSSLITRCTDSNLQPPVFSSCMRAGEERTDAPTQGGSPGMRQWRHAFAHSHALSRAGQGSAPGTPPPPPCRRRQLKGASSPSRNARRSCRISGRFAPHLPLKNSVTYRLRCVK